jgi:N-acetylmuramoyl-L-alanine amidase
MLSRLMVKMFVLPVLVLGVAASLARAEGDTAQTQPAIEKPAMVTTEDWGSDPLPIPDERKHTPKFITIHHAGVDWEAESDPYEKIRNLQAWGKKTVEDGGKDWPDLPYHFLIAPDGRIFEGRPVEYEPETNTNYDVRNHLGVQIWGNFQTQRISPQQVASAVRLTAWLSQQYGVDDALIRGHRDVAEGTSCPGADFYRYLEDGQFLDWVNQVRAGEEPDINLGPPLEDGPTEMIPDSQGP